MSINSMDNPIKKWRKDKEDKNKEDNGSVKIISETGEEIGELKFSSDSSFKFQFQHPKKARVKISTNEHRESRSQSQS